MVFFNRVCAESLFEQVAIKLIDQPKTDVLKVNSFSESFRLVQGELVHFVRIRLQAVISQLLFKEYRKRSGNITYGFPLVLV